MGRAGRGGAGRVGWVGLGIAVLHSGFCDSREVNDYHAAEEFAFIRDDEQSKREREPLCRIQPLPVTLEVASTK